MAKCSNVASLPVGDQLADHVLHGELSNQSDFLRLVFDVRFSMGFSQLTMGFSNPCVFHQQTSTNMLKHKSLAAKMRILNQLTVGISARITTGELHKVDFGSTELIFLRTRNKQPVWRTKGCRIEWRRGQLAMAPPSADELDELWVPWIWKHLKIDEF